MWCPPEQVNFNRAAREALVGALVRDGYRTHHGLRGERLGLRVAEAAALLATVTGQDIDATNDGRFRIFEGTAPDRIISMVNPQTRHGHKLRIRRLALLGGVERPCRAVRCCR